VEIEELSIKNEACQNQLQVAMRAYMEMENVYKRQLRYHEDAEKVAQQRQIAKIVKPIGSQDQNTSFGSFFWGLFSSKPTLPLKQSLTHSEKQGYLTKQGAIIKNWQKRWVVLEGNNLYYFKDHEAQEPRGVIALEDCTIQDAYEQMKRPFCFAIVHPANRAFYFMATSQPELESWMAALNEKIIYLRRLKRPPSKWEKSEAPVGRPRSKTIGSAQERPHLILV